MRTPYRAKLAVLCAVLLIFALLLVTLIPAVWSRLAQARSAAVSAPCAASPWAVIPTPNTGTTGDELVSVSGVSSSDIWAVGVLLDLNHGTATPIAEHWNGSAWSLVPTASLGSSTGFYFLDGVAAVAANDVWVVGAGPNGNLIEQWNGSNWKVVTNPNVTGLANGLSSVTALSATNVWAAGDYMTNSGTTNTLIEHWDGTAWTITPSPNVGPTSTAANYLFQLAGVSANDLWAVGQYAPSNISPFLTLAEHWNGTAWSVVSTPNVSGQNTVFSSVAGVASNDMWAVGQPYTSNASLSATLIEHWNGTTWSIVSSPNPTATNTLLWVSAIAANDVVAVGESTADSLIEQWTGSAWSIVPSPDVGTTRNPLAAVTALSPTDMWAVGEDLSGTNPRQTLALHYRTVIKAGPGSAHAPSYTGTHILCPHVGAGGAASAGAFANPRLELLRFVRARRAGAPGA